MKVYPKYVNMDAIKQIRIGNHPGIKFEKPIK
jgi:hypothetical protein